MRGRSKTHLTTELDATGIQPSFRDRSWAAALAFCQAAVHSGRQECLCHKNQMSITFIEKRQFEANEFLRPPRLDICFCRYPVFCALDSHHWRTRAPAPGDCGCPRLSASGGVSKLRPGWARSNRYGSTFTKLNI